MSNPEADIDDVINISTGKKIIMYISVIIVFSLLLLAFTGCSNTHVTSNTDIPYCNPYSMESDWYSEYNNTQSNSYGITDDNLTVYGYCG